MVRKIFLKFIALIVFAAPAVSQEAGLRMIDREDLFRHLEFIASDEMKGRNTPSPELKLAAKYLAVQAKSYGLQPLFEEGSYFQKIPLEISTVSESDSRITLVSGDSKKNFAFRNDFGISRPSDISLTGELAFAGIGIESGRDNWNDYEGLDCEGKVVIILDINLTEKHPLSASQTRGLMWGRSSYARRNGAIAVLSVISLEKEQKFAESGMLFDNNQRGSMVSSEGSSRRGSGIPFLEIRHDAAATILGISKDELVSMMEDAGNGKKLNSRILSETSVDIKVNQITSSGYTSNVVAWLEGTDPVLKDEYIVFGSHYDHVGTRNGEIYNGADDDGSGTVAMLEIAEAMSVERPKRSVIFVWHTGEEKGLWGSRYFVNNSPVPIHKINAMLQMDMLSRNDPDSIYIIGSHFLSSKLDAINREAAEELGFIELNDLYNDPDKPRNYFRQSDHYPYHTVGIPTTFFFCGVHEDLHSPTDTIEKCDFDKMERVTKLVYLVGMKAGNYDSLFKLDRDPEITSRGKTKKESR